MRDNVNNSKFKLYLLNVSKGYEKTLSSEASDGYVSDDGRYVALSLKNKRTGILDLQTLNQKYFKSSQYYGEALWSPNSEYVGFGLYQYGQDHKTDFIVDMTTFKTIDLYVKTLAWLDDHWVIYEIEQNGEYQLEVRDLKTNAAHNLGKIDNYGRSTDTFFAAISPDKQLVVASPDIHTLTLASFAPLANGTVTNYSTEFGSLNFISDEFYGSNRVTDLSWLNYRLSWSPDSQFLAFVEGRDSGFDLVILDRNMKEIVRSQLPNASFSSLLKWDVCSENF